MNETELEKLVVRLVGDGTKYMAMLEDVQKKTTETAAQVQKAGVSIESMQKSVEGFAGTALKAVGALGISVVFLPSPQDFSDMEKNIIRMNAAIEQNGGNVEQLTQRYSAFAAEIGRVTLVTKGQTMSLLRQAEAQGFSGDTAERLARGAIGLAGATDQEASSMMHVAIMLERGNVQALRRIPQLRGIRSETELVARAQALMEQGMRVQEQLANTTDGKLQRLGNSMKGLGKEVGALISDGIRPVVEWLQKAADWFNKLDPTVRKAIGVTLAIVAALTLLGPAISLISTVIGPMLVGLKLVAGFIVGVFSVAFIKFIAIGAVVVAAIVAVVMALGGFEKVWGYIKNAAIEAWIAIQFGFQNFQRIAAFAWLTFRLKALQVWEELKHFFLSTFPELTSWFINHWQEVLTDFVNLGMTMIGNLATNVVTIISSIPDLITGATNWDDVWRPLTDGFESSISQFPNLTAREIGAVEAQLQDEWQREGLALNQSFNQFRQQRLNEMNRAAAEAGRQGDMIGDALHGGIKHGTDKIEAVLSGSSEALARIAAMRDRLLGGPAASGGARSGAAGGAGRGATGGGVLGTLDTILGSLRDRLVESAQQAWSMVLPYAQAAWRGVQDFFSQGWSGVVANITTTWNTTVAYIMTTWDTIRTDVFNLWDATVKDVLAFWDNGLEKLVEDVSVSILQFISNLPIYTIAALAGIAVWLQGLGPQFNTFILNLTTSTATFFQELGPRALQFVEATLGRLNDLTIEVFMRIGRLMSNVAYRLTNGAVGEQSGSSTTGGFGNAGNAILEELRRQTQLQRQETARSVSQIVIDTANLGNL